MSQTANNVLDQIKNDRRHNPINVKTTDGIYATLEHQWACIQALADYIDGKRTETTVTPAKVTVATASNTPSMNPFGATNAQGQNPNPNYNA